MKIHPMGRSELPLKGIFATCSPARPNPVLINAVELLQRNGNVLRAKGLEAVNGTPLLDIKPYAPMYFRVDAPRLPEWMTSLVQEITEDCEGEYNTGVKKEATQFPRRVAVDHSCQ